MDQETAPAQGNTDLERSPIEFGQDEDYSQPLPGPTTTTTTTIITTTTPSMTPREQALWAMNFDELYQQARNHNFGKGRSES